MYMTRSIRILLIGLLLASPLLFAFAQSTATADTTGAADTADNTDTSKATTAADKPSVVYVMAVDGAITRVTDIRIEEAIKKAEDARAELLVILMDTPGGLVNATWEICKSILNSNVPVCVYISPSGARAGSAGVYITYSSHIAAMAPSTNIGAAHPVSGGGEEMDSVMSEKITNDAVAQIKAAAEKRGRNVEWAEEAVRESVSITNKEALELNVVDLVARGSR